MSSSFRTLDRKLSKACVQLVNGKPYCTLCNIKLPNISVYDSHLKGKRHRINRTYILKELMTSTLLPGIIMKENSDTKDVSIYCILCNQQVSILFDICFRNHLRSSNHLSKVIEQMNIPKAKGLYTFYKYSRFVKSREEDILLKGVSKTRIIVGNYGYWCVPCNFEMVNRSELRDHIREIPHREWAFDQISKVADKVGLSLGIIIRGRSFICKLCNIELGNDLATADAYNHVHDPAVDNEHKKKVQKQIADGLYEFYIKNDMSDSDSWDNWDFADIRFDDSDDSCFDYMVRPPYSIRL